MNSNVGSKGVMWTVLGGEMLNVVYELRYMILLSAILILADLWWGHSDAMKRYAKAEMNDDRICMEKYRWRKSRAIRRTANKFTDYLTFLLIGAFMGLGITEPLGICTHLHAAAFSLTIGCVAEIASILGHVYYVKLGFDVNTKEMFKILFRFIRNLMKEKSKVVGDAMEETFNENK